MGVRSRELLERGGECEVIAGAVADAAAGRGTVTLVEGPAGIGKTRLLERAREDARDLGLTVLAARGSDLEREFGWGIARQLVESAVTALGDADRAALLSGPARVAADVLLAGAGAAAADEGGVLHGLYWVCAGLAERGPLLLCVDDAHWCDLPSLRFLAYLAHRIDGVPVALLVGSRPGEVPRDSELLARLAAEPGATLVRPAPLSDRAAAAVLEESLGQRPDGPFVGACQAATRGNPFLLEELARAARDGGIPPDAGGVGAVADLGPRRVALAIVRRARALSPGAVELARAVAVLGPDAELRHAATLAGLNATAAGHAADALTAAEILADVRPLDVVHPLTRAAIMADMTRAERDVLHGAAARLLHAEGGAPGRVAAHLLHTEPRGDPWTVGVLFAAGADAVARGAPSTAVTYLERALTEPPPAPVLPDVLHQLGRAEAIDGVGGDFEEHLRRAMATSTDPQQRGAAGLELARAHGIAGDFLRSGRICIEVLEALDGTDAPVVAALEAELVGVATNEWSLAQAARPLRRSLTAQGPAGTDGVDRLGALGILLVCGSPPAATGAAIVARAAAHGTMPANSQIPGIIGQGLHLAGRSQDAHAHFSALRADAERRGVTAWLSPSESFSSAASLALGEVRRAEEEAHHALELLERSRRPGRHQHLFHLFHLAIVLLERDRPDEAHEVLQRLPVAGTAAANYSEALWLHACSCVALARDEPERALACALGAGAEPLRRTNPALAPWRSDAARALVALGRHEEAAGVAAEELALARAFDVPYAIGRALRAAAAAEEDLDCAAATLEAAIARVDGTEARLELGYARVELGAVLRRAGRRTAAVEHLRIGLDLAHRGGATLLAGRAHGELLTAGARPRRAVLSGADALTPSERRVVDLAAAGRTNQQIAQALFVTTRTVEAHLTRAFRKLDVTSRTDLRAALDAVTPGALLR